MSQPAALALLISILFTPLVCPSLAHGEDWPRWRGPRADGISTDPPAPVSFGPKENLLWRIEPPGSGHSSPIILGDAIFLTAAVGEGAEARRVLLRYDRRDGKLLWEREVLRAPLEGKHQKNSFSSGTPATDGERIYVSFAGAGRAHAAALSLEGKVLWSVSPCGFKSVHGFCTTPVLFEELVILNCDQDSEEAAIVALEKSTGKERWRTERKNHLRSYVPPLIAEAAGRPQMVLAGSKCISSYDPRTGERLWYCDGPTEQCVATAVYGRGLFIITGGFPDREVMAIRPDGKGDVTQTHVAWRARKGVSYVPSPILVGENFFVVNDETGVACCYQADSGKLLWQERLGGSFSSSMAASGGNIYLGSEGGDLHVFAAGAKFERRATNSFGEGIFATPAFADGKIYLRTTKALYAFGSPATAARPVQGGGKETLTALGAPKDAAPLPDAMRVFNPPRLPEDERLGKLKTLEDYHPWTPITDPEAWKHRRQRVRDQVLLAAGIFPLPEPADRSPLNAVVRGAIDRGDYTVEKVHFESYPGFHVTGNLYRPKSWSGARRPAVLCPHGHWQNGRLYERGEKEAEEQVKAGKEKTMEGARFPLQARCVQLARMGCVVFFYDMVGSNPDSFQIGHGAGFKDAAAELKGHSAFGLQTWNSIRALDFLSSLPDVDPGRIGVTGASGGGTQTFILCAIDDRPAVAFPAVMVSTAMQGGCVCENASYLRLGTGNIELAALCAPRPLGMSGANDWSLEIETKGLPELKALYAALGAPDMVMAKCFPAFEHNYNQVSRELMYGWMDRHLRLGFPEPVEEKPFQPIAPEELRVFDESHPHPKGSLDAAGLRKEIEEILPSIDGDHLARAVEIMLGEDLAMPVAAEAEIAGESASGEDGLRAKTEKLLLRRKGSRESIPAVLLRPGKASGDVVLLVHPSGKAGALAGQDGKLAPLAAKLLERGAAILAPDLYLTGEYHLPGQTTPNPKVNGDYAGYTYGYNRTLLAQRSHDLLTALAYARALEGTKRVHLAGLERAGIWTLLARVLAGDGVVHTAVDLDHFLWEDVKSTADEMMLPGALRFGGTEGLLSFLDRGDVWAYRPKDLSAPLHHLLLSTEKPAEEELAAWLLKE